jgi:hypothetical protein
MNTEIIKWTEKNNGDDTDSQLIAQLQKGKPPSFQFPGSLCIHKSKKSVLF